MISHTRFGHSATMATSVEELCGFTIEQLRELCAEKHIAVHSKKKEELIAALMEAEPKGPVVGGAPAGPSTYCRAVRVDLEMQQEQIAWMVVQQKQLEEWMLAQQECHRELMEELCKQLAEGQLTVQQLAEGSSVGLEPEKQQLKWQPDADRNSKRYLDDSLEELESIKQLDKLSYGLLEEQESYQLEGCREPRHLELAKEMSQENYTLGHSLEEEQEKQQDRPKEFAGA